MFPQITWLEGRIIKDIKFMSHVINKLFIAFNLANNHVSKRKHSEITNTSPSNMKKALYLGHVIVTLGKLVQHSVFNKLQTGHIFRQNSAIPCRVWAFDLNNSITSNQPIRRAMAFPNLL